jgi:NAD(P)-dependent dehydrogenase (short-subunit alcohol dehydrogenase family)
MTDHNTVVVVTGASSGIGAEVADVVASRGARVVLIGRREHALADVASGLRPHKDGPHVVLACDVTDADVLDQELSRVSDEAGIPTALVNCAGICLPPASLAELAVADWYETININLTGSFLAIRAVATRLQRSGMTGSIVNVGSEASFLGMPGYSAYCSSKTGLIGLTKALAAELAPDIRVNLLCPGPVDTPMLRAELAGTGDLEKAWQSEIARIPLGRIGTARETAEAAVWLLWDAAHATGSILSLDGGTTGAFMGAKA